MKTLNDLINNNWFLAVLCLISPLLWRVVHDIIVKSREHYLNRSLHSHNTAFSKVYSQQFDIYIELYRKIGLMNEEYKALKKFRKDDISLANALALLQQTHLEAYSYYKKNKIFFSNRMDSNLNLFFLTFSSVLQMQNIKVKAREGAERFIEIKKATYELEFSVVPQSLCESPLDDLNEPIDEFDFDNTLSALKKEFRDILRMK